MKRNRWDKAKDKYTCWICRIRKKHPVIAATVNLIAQPLYSPARALQYETKDIIVKGFREGMQRAQEDEQAQEFVKWFKEQRAGIENESKK